MGLFSKNKKAEQPKPQIEPDAPSFTFGVEEFGPVKDSDDMLVIGRLKGTVKVGMGVYVSAPGQSGMPILVTTVKELQANGKPAESATDGTALMILENARSQPFFIGSVVHGRNASGADVHNTYINALGDVFLTQKQLMLEPDDFDRMSLTDMTEVYNLYVMFMGRNPIPEQDKAAIQLRVDVLMGAMISKFFDSDEIYLIYSKATGEPYMFSQTIQREQGYETTPPDVMFVTAPYYHVFSKHYTQGDFDMVKLGRGEDGNGIKDLLGMAFYLNGVCGVEFNNLRFAIDKSKLVPAPDYSGTKDIEVPVTNPDLMRWILLMGQMTDVSEDGARIMYSAYNSLFMRELPKAKFLVPMKVEGSLPQADDDGMAKLERNTTIGLATMPGKNGRNAVKMYTDWKRLREVYGEDWSGMIESVQGFISNMDCAINVTEHIKAGVYIDRDTWDSASKTAQ
ncbi:MAG: SseB family protein [Saccharofermentans sp.]|nr:SseB family protein [Saccharofermentans sp.]